MGVLSAQLLQPVDVVVDSREASSVEDVVELLKAKGLRVAVAKLGAGDYYLLSSGAKPPVLVERKTVQDFANSIRDGRLWDQAARLARAAAEDGARPVIVLEGWLGRLERTGWSMAAVLRAIDELALGMGIPVVPSPNRYATVEWLAAKAKALGRTEEKRVVRLRVDKKPPTLMERILYVAEGLAGPKLARRLLQHFGTLRAVANASVSQLTRVEGIGEKRAQEIYAIFNTRWRPPEEERGG
ncbi:ERCC4 domain-containing protein [Stetteria hydrogenophila]